MMTPEEIARALNGKPTGDGWICHCPAHDDDKASLSLTVGKGGRILVHCHAGCTQDAVIAALKNRGLWPQSRQGKRPAVKPRIVATYEYRNESGKVLFESVRYDPKGFKQRRPDGEGGWKWNLQGVRRVLYRLPELLTADPTESVYVIEGEKDAHRIGAWRR